MPTSKPHRSISEERPKSKKSASFHGRIPASSNGSSLRRPRTQTDLLAGRKTVADSGFSPENLTQKLTKLLLNVTVQRSLGPVQVLISPESTVGDLIGAAIRLYVKESRRPFLAGTDPAGFDLHYSQFSLESLDPKEKLIGLGSRSFFLCPKIGDVTCLSSKPEKHVAVTSCSSQVAVTSCSSEAEKPVKNSWFKFLGFNS